MKKITFAGEIMLPKLMTTSSLDGSIKLWDLNDRILIIELRDDSTSKGIRGLTYSYEYGGNLLSYGFETHINVWCPEVSLTRSFIGKLEGHTSTVVCVKFVPKSPNCISTDEKCNIKVWDIRTLQSIQNISTE